MVAQTNYEPEKIIYNGDTYEYRYHHMEQYFKYYPNRRPVENVDSTIVNRNYIALFEINDNKFYLKDIFINLNKKTKNKQSVLKHVNTKQEPMFLNWITGLYDVGLGEKKFINNDTINPVYDHYFVFEVKKGEIGRTENFTYNQMKLFKDYQYRRFKSTSDYQKLYKRLLYNGMTESEAHFHIYQFILFYSKSNFLKK